MKLLFVIFVCVSVFDDSVLCHKIDTSLHRERVSDGAFASRGEGHDTDEEHDSNFDHESILGSYATKLIYCCILVKIFNFLLI